MPKTTHDSERPAEVRQVISACAFIHHDFDGVKKLFLPRRAATKKFLSGLFELPGGHISVFSGRQANKVLWPRLHDWVMERSSV